MATDQAVAEGQLLVQVPSSLMVTAHTAAQSALCGELVQTSELPEWQVWLVLSAALMFPLSCYMPRI